MLINWVNWVNILIERRSNYIDLKGLSLTISTLAYNQWFSLREPFDLHTLRVHLVFHLFLILRITIILLIASFPPVGFLFHGLGEGKAFHIQLENVALFLLNFSVELSELI